MNTLLTKGKMRLVTMLLASLVGCMNVAKAFAATPPPTIYTDFVYFNASLSDFTLTTDSTGTTMISSSVYDLTFKPDSLAPAMPYIPITVMLHADRAYHGLYYSTLDEVAASNVTMAANPIPVPTSMAARHSSTTIPKALASATLYPAYGQNVEYVGNSYADGHQLLHFLFCPFTYNATTHQLIFHNEISLEYEFYGDGSNTDNPPVVGTLDAGYFRSFVYNKDAVSTIMASDVQYTAAHAQTMGYNPDPSAPKLDYLIVTDSVLVDSFMPLIEWKRTKGLKADIVTTQYIYRTAENASDSNQLKIKKYLKQCYLNNRLTYVLLGGDAQIVPAQGCYGCVPNNNSPENPSTDIPTDLYYASYSGRLNWDFNNNGIYGEALDGTILSSDVFITRSLVANQQEANTFVSKTLFYEKTPSANGWNNNILLCGVKLSENKGGKSDANIAVDRLASAISDTGWTGQIYKFCDTYSDFPGGANYDVTRSNLNDILSQGFTFFDINSHGNDILWDMESGPHYYSSDAGSLINIKPMIITTEACHTNDFSSIYQPCLSKAFIVNPANGVVAYFGSSRYGWHRKAKQGISEMYNTSFYQTLFDTNDSNKNFGKVVAVTKSKYRICSWLYGAYRWLQFSLNAIGDPEMPIFTSTPMSLSANVSYQTNNTLVITANTSSCNICVSYIPSEGADKVYRVVKGVQSATFQDVYSDVTICITKQNYIPLLVDYKINELYIQNRTIDDSTLFQADIVKIGKDVTNQISQGAVVFDQSDTTIRAHKVEIKSTTINRNAKVTFKKRN